MGRFEVSSSNRNKIAKLDGIAMGILSATDDFGFEKIMEIVNKRYDSVSIPKDHSKYIFVSLSNKRGEKQSDVYRTISLIGT